MTAHFLHVYEKPAIGNGVLKKFPVYNYRHKISAMGGYDTASCSLALNRADAETIFQNYVGNRVAIFVDNPVSPCWEGYINRVNLNTGAVQMTVSMDKMANRVIVQWSDGTGGVPPSTAEATNAASIALYGSKTVHVDLGELYSTGTTYPTAVRDALNVQRPFPQQSSVGGGSGGSIVVDIEMLGFYHTLTWDTFEVVTTDATDIPRKLLTTTAPSYTYNSGIFYDDSDTSRVVATTSYTAPGIRKAGESTWDMALKLAEASPSGLRYVVGISETNPNTGNRIAYFEAANEDVLYEIDAYGDGRILLKGGLIADPWDIRPNRSILIRNIMIGQEQTFDTGKIAYIKSIDYDAESGTVTWQTDDNITLPGVFNLSTQMLATNEDFGAPRRSQVTSDYVIDSLRVSGNAQVGEATAPIQATSAGRNYLTVQGSTSVGIVEVGTEAADADGTTIGQFGGSDPNSSGEKRIAVISVVQEGATAGNRGGGNSDLDQSQ